MHDLLILALVSLLISGLLLGRAVWLHHRIERDHPGFHCAMRRGRK